jgi:hypothetical protein
MSKTRFKDIKHFFYVTPDQLDVKGFADGVEGKLELSWQHPMLHSNEDDEQPAEGSNYLRIEVISEWQPTDHYFTNIPTPNEDQLLVIVSRRKSGRQVVFHCRYYGIQKVWMDYTLKTPEEAFDNCNMEVVEFKLINL